MQFRPGRSNHNFLVGHFSVFSACSSLNWIRYFVSNCIKVKTNSNTELQLVESLLCIQNYLHYLAGTHSIAIKYLHYLSAKAIFKWRIWYCLIRHWTWLLFSHSRCSCDWTSQQKITVKTWKYQGSSIWEGSSGFVRWGYIATRNKTKPFETPREVELISPA